MKVTSLSTRFVIATALALGGLGATVAAHAASDVHFFVGLQAPGAYVVQPAPVYVEPQPVYVQPRPVYVQPRPVVVVPPAYFAPPAYVAPARPVYANPYEAERARRYAAWQWQEHHHQRVEYVHGHGDRRWN
jgi:hypothetical protein